MQDVKTFKLSDSSRTKTEFNPLIVAFFLSRAIFLWMYPASGLNSILLKSKSVENYKLKLYKFFSQEKGNTLYCLCNKTAYATISKRSYRYILIP